MLLHCVHVPVKPTHALRSCAPKRAKRLRSKPN